MKTRAGFTLLEMLLVLSIMGILMAISIPMLRAPSAYLFAADLKAMIQQARLESIKRNVPVALVWRSNNQTFTTQLHPTSPVANQACNATGTTILQTKNLTDYRNLSVTTAFTQRGLVWLPTGLGTKCNDEIMSDGTTVTDGRSAYRVLTSTAGRVRIEKQP